MPKFSRPNTIEEKRKMRRTRKNRIRSRSKLLEAQVQLESTLRSEAEKNWCYTKTCVGRIGRDGIGSCSSGRIV